MSKARTEEEETVEEARTPEDVAAAGDGQIEVVNRDPSPPFPICSASIVEAMVTRSPYAQNQTIQPSSNNFGRLLRPAARSRGEGPTAEGEATPMLPPKPTPPRHPNNHNGVLGCRETNGEDFRSAPSSPPYNGLLVGSVMLCRGPNAVHQTYSSDQHQWDPTYSALLHGKYN